MLGRQISSSIGKIRKKFPIVQHSHFDLKSDVVNVDIPLMIGLDILRSRNLLYIYFNKRLIYCNEKVNRPVTIKHQHVIVEWDQSEIPFTRK